MFACDQCGKTFATKGTLTRHERNHQADRRHSCPTCHVSFRRSDLLARHRRIHQDATASSPMGQYDDIDPSQTRRRCHTACNSCRASRMKCNGKNPCSACIKSGSDCQYRSESARMSQQDFRTRSTRQTEDGLGAMENALGGNGLEESADITADDFAPFYPTPISGTTGLSLTEYSDGANLMNTAQPLVGDDDTLSIQPDMPNNQMDTNFWPFSTSWQWTHEGLYFPGEDMIQMTDETGTLTEQDLGLTGMDSLLDQSTKGTSTPRRTRQAWSRLAEEQRPTLGNLDNFASNQSDSPHSLKEVVQTMVNYAASDDHSSKVNDTEQWDTFSEQLSRLITTNSASEASIRNETVLNDMTNQYFDHFHPLWPLIARSASIQDEVHPMLYLTLTSIGALYSGTDTAVRYGSIMHTTIRNTLIQQPSLHDHTEEEALDIGRAMLLTQVAALYFEQDRAFSAAQRLGAALNAHGHRMRLFTVRQSDVSQRNNSEQALSKRLSLVEGRKMLAYGMFRAETFLSVLFNTKPLISYEELNLPLPFTREWTGTAFYDASNSTPSSSSTLFSDLVRIALDSDEILPMLSPSDVELLMFGLQHEVWRFAQDPELFKRLIGIRHPRRNIPRGQHECGDDDSAEDLLDHTNRKMTSLVVDYQRLISAMAKWKQAMSHCQHSHRPDANRSTYLSGLVLHELSFLRLYAPINAIQQTAYQIHEPSTSDPGTRSEIAFWTFTQEAAEAVAHARSIWQMLHTETARLQDKQAKYNILALIALQHAAVVIWAVAGTNGQPNNCLISNDKGSTSDTGTWKLRRANTNRLMLRFADLYSKITCTWGMQSSFSKMVRKLADHPFPEEAA